MPPANQSKVPVGTLVGGKFRVTKEIGRGGMAVVYEAENVDIGKRVAVKILSAELLSSRVVRERFLREARAAAAIRSPYICDVYDSGVFEERPFLVMELLEGESLYDLMTRVRRIDLQTTLTVATHTARGLAKAHEANIVHRDLKPENIFLTKTEDGTILAKILDFGLAKFYAPTGGDAAQARLTREGALFGTPAYMSPEQAKGQGEVDLRADLWALGCIVYECLTAQTVWNVEQGVAMILAQIAGAPIPRPSRLRPDLPPAFDEWFAKALDRDPSKRFQTARELADALGEALDPRHGPRSMPALSTPGEEAVVDELITGKVAAPPPTAAPAPQPSPAPAPELDSPPAKRGSAGAILALFGAGSLAVAGYAGWLWWSEARLAGSAPAASASAAASASTSAAPTAPAGPVRPLEADPYALQVAEAQARLAAGKRQDALTLFKEAFNNGGSGVARGLLNHAAVALVEAPKDSRCVVTGLARPRPYDSAAAVTRPDVLAVTGGTLVAWADAQADASKRQAQAVVLDEALRRVSPPRSLTPEASAARHVQLTRVGEKIVLLWWEDGGAEPGVYARFVEVDGRIAGPARRVAATKKQELHPSLVPAAGEDAYWVVWAEAVVAGAVDLFARKLGPTLEPVSEPIRLTALQPGKPEASVAARPDVAVAHGNLRVVFTLERGREHPVHLLTVPLAEAIAPGLAPQPGGKPPPADRYLGKVAKLGPDGKGSQAQLACAASACFAVWDGEKSGAHVALLDEKSHEPLWHRELGKRASRPSVAMAGDTTMLAWFEGARVRLGRVTRDGLEPSTPVARVSGVQPYPSLVAGAKPGEWLVAWRDYESARLEAYLVRAECR